MEDQDIIALFFSRSEAAIRETAEKYGTLSRRISKNILGSDADAEECVNDAYLALWNEIPPTVPRSLGAFLSRLVRNISLDRLDKENAARRKGETLPLLEELCDILGEDNDKAFDSLLFRESLNRFLSKSEKESRLFFVRRYFYCDSVSDIAKFYSTSESRVKSSLFRTRKKLAEHLKKEGFEIE